MCMTAKKIARINFLAKKQREGALTPKEAAEQKALREEYLAAVRRNFRQTLESIEYTD